VQVIERVARRTDDIAHEIRDDQRFVRRELVVFGGQRALNGAPRPRSPLLKPWQDPDRKPDDPEADERENRRRDEV
jgi:hypothetical protein